MTKLLSFLLLLFILVSSILAVLFNYIGDFDPVKIAVELKNNNRRDEALDVIDFAKENKIGNQQALNVLSEKYNYSVQEKAKDMFFYGVVKGEIFNFYSGLGAITSDLCVIGDVRDLGKQGYNFVTGKDVDYCITALSGIGLASTIVTATGIGAPEGAVVHAGESFVKATIKYCGRVIHYIPESVLKVILKGEKVGVEVYKKIWLIFKGTQWNLPSTVTILSKIKNVNYLDHAITLTGKMGKGSAIFIDKAGETGLITYSYLNKLGLGNFFINSFKAKPKAVLGITKFNTLTHSIKIYKKQGALVPLTVILTSLACLLALLPTWLPFFTLSLSGLLIGKNINDSLKNRRYQKPILKEDIKLPLPEIVKPLEKIKNKVTNRKQLAYLFYASPSSSLENEYIGNLFSLNALLDEDWQVVSVTPISVPTNNIKMDISQIAALIILEKGIKYVNEGVDDKQKQQDEIYLLQGRKQCPTCKNWDVHRAYIEDGGQGDWCPHCKKSLQLMGKL